jgi:hypothetical protein
MFILYIEWESTLERLEGVYIIIFEKIQGDN